ncbi:VTC domain-containing protein [Circinella umbellata]|nr:VTC domain-containing protein [Circinella umbellata]
MAATINTFAEELEKNIYEPWRFQYVSYEAIQRDIQKRLDQGWSVNDEADFKRTIHLEAEKVEQFITRKQRDIDSRVTYCERSLVQQRQQQQQRLSASNSQQKQMYDAMADSLTEVLMDLNDLSKYTRLNFLALTNLIKYHDQQQGNTNNNNSTTKQLLIDISRSNKPLGRQRFDTTLVKISTLLDICRLYGENRRNSSGSAIFQNSQHHTTSERATAKYWVHPDNVTELKAILLFHLPVLVHNPEKAVESSDSAVSSVYFDNNDFDLYSGQLERDEGAEAIRFRWYGPVTSSQDIFVERRTHHTSPLLTDDNGYTSKDSTPASWMKDRFPLNANNVDNFIAKRYTIQQYNSTNKQEHVNKFIFEGVQQSVQDKHLQPVMRIFYSRTTFQVPEEDNNNLCVRLDTDLTFVREDDPRKTTWRRPDMGIDYPFKSLPQNQVYHFPYAVLETKLQAGEPPEWLTRLLDSRLVYEVPRFSKYLQGAAHFWKPKLPLLPWWLSELDIDIRNAKQTSSGFTGLSRSRSLKPLIDGRYRMGYLESQLDNRATIKRQPSNKLDQQQQQHKVRGYPVAGGMVTGTIPQQKQDESHVVNVNPFDDPIWANGSNEQQSFSLEFDHDSQGSSRFNNFGTNGVRNRGSNCYSGLDLPTPRNGFVDSSSTDHLVEHQQRGSTPRSFSMADTGDRNTSSYYTNDNRTVVATPNGQQQTLRDSAYLGVDSSEGGVINMNDDYKSNDEGNNTKQKKKKKDKQQTEQIEPKIFFANERTFINWLQFSALILTAALMLLNFGDDVSKIAGATFFGISMILALYAFARYRYRAWQITNRPRIRYDDIYGPIGLCILVVGALLVNFILRIQQPPTTSTYLGISNQTQST